MRTLKDFDYDLWSMEEGNEKHYWVRVKSTGQECEVDYSVMKLLQNEEHQMRRKIAVALERNTDLSLDTLQGNDEGEYWLKDSYDLEGHIINQFMLDRFKEELTTLQYSVFTECILEGKTYERFALEHGIGKTAVSKHITLIRKKAKIFFG